MSLGRRVLLKFPPELFFFGSLIVGVDPGRNFGIAVVSGNQVSVINGKIPQMEKQMYGDWMSKQIFGVAEEADKVVIEGPSYNEGYGQVLLAEIRYGAYLGALSAGVEVWYEAPMSARKKVFGHGKVRGSDIWPFLNGNAADAVVLAISGGVE